MLLHAQENNLLDYHHTLQFARYLSAGTQYKYAIEEYERLYYYFPHDTVIIYELAKNYRLSRQCPRLERVKLLVDTSDKLFHSPILIKEYIHYAFDCNKTTRLIPYFSQFSSHEQALLHLGKLWMEGRYQQLRHYSGSQSSSSFMLLKDLEMLTQKFGKESYKNPGVALGLSALIPGAGKWYAGRRRDALMSFLLTTSNAYLSYRFFKEKGLSSVNGWLFGGFALSFYAGNLFGSYKAAKEYNEGINKAYQDEAKSIIYRFF